MAIVTAAALIATACASAGDPPTATSWGARALAFNEAATELLNDQGPLGVLPFYDEAAVLDARATQTDAALYEGLDEVASSIFFGFSSGSVAWTRDAPLYVDRRGSAMTGVLRLTNAGTTIEDRFAVLRPSIGAMGIEHEINMPVSTLWRTFSWRDPALADQAEELAARWINEWTSGGRSHPEAAFYAPGVLFEDTLVNVSVRGPRTIAALGRLEPEIAWTLESPTEAPPVFVYTAGGLSTRDPLAATVFTVTGDLGNGCPGRQLVWLTVDEDGLVTSERRFRSVRDSERCFPSAKAPAGWWTFQPVPDPAAMPYEDLETETGMVTLGGHTTSIRHGTPALQSLVAWALARFALAGMPLPRAEAITFTAFSDYCSHLQGRSVPEMDDGEITWQVVLCMDEESACQQPACNDFTSRAKRALLHELGHVWLSDNLSPARKELFTEFRSLTNWDDHDQPWVQRAREHAAEFLAWGLLDVPFVLVDLGEPSLEARLTGFQILTNRQPLQQWTG